MPHHFTTTIDQDGVATTTLTQEHAKVNKLSAGVWAELDTQITAWREDPAIRAVVLTSGKPGVFLAGADIAELRALRTSEEVDALVRSSQDTLTRLEQCGKPVVAALNGSALGGGLEVVLACHGVVAVDSEAILLGLPETRLGLIPGAGGTQRFTRMAGISAAVDLIRRAVLYPPRDGMATGIIDNLVPAEDLQATARHLALTLAEGEFKRDWDEMARQDDEAALARNHEEEAVAAVQAAVDTTAVNAASQLAACKVITLGMLRTFEEGLALERQAFVELFFRPEVQELMEAFFRR